MQLFLTLLAISIGLFLAYLRYLQSYWRRRGIPHNEPHFPFGDLKDFRKTKSLNEILTPIYKKFKGTGPFAGVYFLASPKVLLLDIELVKNVLIKDFNLFQDRGVFHNEREDPLTGNLFSTEGDHWRSLRQKLSPTFTSGKMKYMFPTVVDVGAEFAKVMTEKVKAAPDGVLEITDLLARFTADVIGSCAFGLDCNSMRNPNAEFVVMGKRAIVDRNHAKPIDLFIESFPELAIKLNMKQVHPDITNFYMRIVRDTMSYREKNQVKRNDFMNILLGMKSQEENGKLQNGGLSFNDIVAQAFIFFVAGFETSSTTMGFTLYELAKHQDIQDKLRKEINEVLAKHNNEFTYECMKDMKYMEQVISETLRKYPILPQLVRKAKANYSTGNPKYVIEKGATVIIPVYGIHYDPEYYPEPEKFIPERFSEEEIKKRPACTWLPFGDGPRNCIGLRFGKMQASIGLMYLIKNFKFTTCARTHTDIPYIAKSILLSAVDGIQLKLEKL